MTAYVFPNDRFSFGLDETLLRPGLSSGVGLQVVVYLDEAATTLAVIKTTANVVIPDSVLTVGADSLLPRFIGPDDIRLLWARSTEDPDGPTYPMDADLAGRLAEMEAAGGIIGHPGAQGESGVDGADGAPGTPGANGTNGTNGADGINGTNGLSPLLWHYGGPLMVVTGQGRLYNDTGATITLGTVRASLGAAPGGLAVIVDVKKNGATSIFTSRPTVAIGAFTSGRVTPTLTTLADGEYLTVDIIQVGSTANLPGVDLTLQIERAA